MFIDRAVVEVRSGKGGDGMIAFLHLKYIPKGGPSGGNGGRGGSIIFRANSSINTLINFRHSRVITAEDGGKGDIKLKYGRSANDVYVDLPVGTVIYDEKSGQILADLDEDGREILVAKGGRGGRGNAAFKSARNRVPKIAENGLPGETKRLILELKLLADVGFVGLPNAGKSTLLSVISNSRPEIADYPFTTIQPNLGVVVTKDGNSFVAADLPGLIEGASQGKGLGTTFLRHLQRCRVIAHLVAMDGVEDPLKSYNIIVNEIKSYGFGLEKRPTIIVCTKMDSEGAEERYKDFVKNFKGTEIIPICSITHDGVDKVINSCYELLSKTPKFPLFEEDDTSKVKVYDATKTEKEIFHIEKENSNSWRITGESIERTYSLINISTDEGLMRLINYLRKIGIDDELRRLGAKDGDTVYLCDFEFEYME